MMPLLATRKTYILYSQKEEEEEEKHTLYIILQIAEIGTISLRRHPKLPKQHATLSPGLE